MNKRSLDGRLDTSMLNDPFFIGFDRMLDRMNTTNTLSTTKYPPYNIIKTEDSQYELQLAIAGFTYDDLEITLKEGQLTINGNQTEEEPKNYLHRGISARNFSRQFTLMDTIVVNGATLEDGILTVQLENVIPEEKKPRKIDISRPSEKEFLKG